MNVVVRLQRVLGDVDQHRTGAAGAGDVERRGDRGAGCPSGSVTRKLCLVIGIVMPRMSASWKASVPIAALGTWPVMATIGTESM